MEAVLSVAGIVCSCLLASLGGLWFFYVLRAGKLEPGSSNHGGQLVAQALQAQGVRFVFTLVGGHISPILVACEHLGIRVIDTRHEVTAVFAADAVARLSGVPGVAAVTAGPGITNTITAVKNAQMAETPLILIGGAAASLLKGRGALQDIDQMALLKPICKWCATVKRIRDIIPLVRQAFFMAQSGVPGPVFLEFPIDMLYPYQIVFKEMRLEETEATKKEPLMQKIIKMYLRNVIHRQFGDAWLPQPVEPIPPTVPLASAADIQKAAAYITKAKKPVILLGSQATLPPVPVEQLRHTLERMGIPCYLAGMSRGLLGRNNPIHIRQERNEALKEADVIILAGCVCDFRLTYGSKLSKRAKVIAVNRSRQQLLLNAGFQWDPTLAVVSDVASFVQAVAARLSAKYTCPPQWLATLQQRNDKREAAIVTKGLDETEFINPIYLHQQLEQLLPEDSILVADGGDFVGTAAYILRPRGPLRWLDPGAFGTLGVGGGFALGAKLCRPEAEVWIIYGDGSLGYSLAEFDTYTRHKIPILALVGNDGCWTQIAREQVPVFKSSVACDLARCHYHISAKGLGAEGMVVQKKEEVKAALVQAQKLAADGKAVLINAFIGKTDFREGSISV